MRNREKGYVSVSRPKSMIRIVQVSIKHGETILRVQADFPDGAVKAVEVDYGEVEGRLKRVRELLGREPTEEDFRDAVKAIINEMRAAKRPLEKKFPFEQYMNVDLEAGQ